MVGAEEGRLVACGCQVGPGEATAVRDTPVNMATPAEQGSRAQAERGTGGLQSFSLFGPRNITSTTSQALLQP